MSDTSENNKRIAKNTILLYFRMLLLMFIGLYTSRVVLSALGFSDYGLYNVVGGIVAMLGFLNSSLSGSTQRFLNYEMGTGAGNLDNVFSNALLIHFFLAGFILILAFTVGLWFVYNKLNIPEGRETAVLWCYTLSVFTACIGVVKLPFMATILAHERMNVFAYVSIFEALINLGIAFLVKISPFDTLIYYSILLCIATHFTSFLYILYSRKSFSEVSFIPSLDKKIFRQIIGFSSWNIIGNVAATCNNYGLNILYNLFFGTIVNAARGVTYQVGGVIQQFSSNFQLAVKPQVIKYYAEGKIDEMYRLVFLTAKFSSFLLLVIIVPLFFELENVLQLWLGDYPIYTLLFLRIILLQMVFQAIIGPVLMVVHASGYLKEIAITAGLFNLSLLPINYVLFRLGLNPEVALIVNFIGTIVETLLEVLWMHHFIKFPLTQFYYKVYINVLLVTFFSFTTGYFVQSLNPFESGFFSIVSTTVFTFISTIFFILLIGLEKRERENVLSKIRSKIAFK